MRAEKRQDRSSLGWIRGDLDQSLDEVRTALEAVLEGDKARVQDCLDGLHHIHGVLDLVQVYGGAMLAGEMERLVQSIAHGKTTRLDGAAEALMLGVAQLPAYLEKVQHGAPDIPVDLLPIMNDLRAASESPLVTESALMAPKLDAIVAAEPVHPGSGNRDLPKLVVRKRGRFHRYLLAWFRNEDVEDAIRGIRKLVVELRDNVGTARMRRLLDAVEAVCLAMIESGEATPAAVKSLFGHLDRVFKQVIDQGEESSMLDFPIDLLKNLLFYVSRSTSEHPTIVALKQSPGVAQGFPSELGDASARGFAVADREMFMAVGEAIGQDLRQVKDRLDLYIRSDRTQIARLVELGPAIQRIGDTLGMVGRGDLRTRLKRRVDAIAAVEASGEPPADDSLMALAGDLLYVESSLDDLGAVDEDSIELEDAPDGVARGSSVSSAEMLAHMRAAIDESAVELARVKDDFLQYFERPEDPALLAPVPARLHDVAGACRVLGMPDAAMILGAFAGYVDRLVGGDEALPDEPRRDGIADVLVATELYMRSLVEPGEHPLKLKSVAVGGLRALGLPDPTAADALAPVVVEAGSALPDAEPELALDAVPGPDSEPAGELAGELELEPLAAEAERGLDGRPAADMEPVLDEMPEPHAGLELEALQLEPLETPDAEREPDVQAVPETEPEPALDDAPASYAGLELEALELEPLAAPEAKREPDAPPEPYAELEIELDALPEPAAGDGGIEPPPPTSGIEAVELELVDVDDAVPDALPDVGGRSAAPPPAATDDRKPPAPEREPELEIDPEILEVFLEEAEEELGVIQRLYPQWRASPQDRESLGTFRRSFHTLKGSGRIVGATNVGEFAWAVENLLNRVMDGTVAQSDALFALLDDAVGVLPDLVAETRSVIAGQLDVQAIRDRAFALAAGEVPAAAAEPVADATQDAVPVEDASDIAAVSADVSAAGQAPEEVATADESILTEADGGDSEFHGIDAVSGDDMDTSLYAVFIDEAEAHLGVLQGFLAEGRDAARPVTVDQQLARAMHTLRGSARIAGVEHLADVAGALEKLADGLLVRHATVPPDVLAVFARGHDHLARAIASQPGARGIDPESEALVAAVVATTEDLDRLLAEAAADDVAQTAGVIPAGHPNAGIDPDLLEIFLDEAKELVDEMEAGLVAWSAAGADDKAPVARLQRTLHTMKGGARLGGVVTVGDLSHAMESAFEAVNEGRVQAQPALRDLVRLAADNIAQDIDILAREGLPDPHPALIDALEAAARGKPFDLAAVLAQVSAEAPGDVFEAPAGVAVAEAAMVDAPSTVERPAAGATVDFETVERGGATQDSSLLTDSQIYAESQLLTESELLEETSYLVDGELLPHVPGAVGTLIPVDSTIVRLAGGDAGGADDGFVARRPRPQQDRPSAVGGERVRVPSETLDQMVNHAGEVSIYRARIEQQNTSFAFNLGELGQTIDRLRGQLRTLEIETEAQILSRHEREGDMAADFDPLEMDRYSTIQQLSRALSETVEDLSNLGNSLGDLSRDTDTLLLQQARVTTDLQDSLLRTRMVKFSSRIPRLERVVRQTAQGLGKQAVLKISGGREDVDRTILENMMGPLEHLMRNAVSHGIEEPEAREAQGKSAEGVISLSVAREGSDIIMSLADDGAGLDKARILAKAVERGMLAADAEVTDDDVYQLILQPGFSTAAELSQVSGRGVGMDVVLTEVKQLGGSLDIASRPGRGSTFTIRLPYTLAITDSLLITLADDIYAVPHSSLDGVVRVPADELRAIYDGERGHIEYAGRKYVARYLGAMLGVQAPHVSEGQRWCPMLLVRSGEHRFAIQVDGLMGNRQIVVKSVGAQLSTVRWFTGGTILADGQIALILDMNSLIRADHTSRLFDSALTAREPESPGITVMVVDDSITVRKVTSRLLERHNMHVITAKDGVDAVTQLQESRPDIMLLDIEMPRMDGYELARHVRSTPELSHIPIIMITSRSGEKHRARAFELGVKRYLGKPYQEAELLESIYGLLAEVTR